MNCLFCKIILTGKSKKYCSDIHRIKYWIQNNKDKRKKSWRKYLDTHREQQRQRSKNNYHTNKERDKKYRFNHRVENNARTRAKYALKKLNVPKICNKCKTKQGRIDVHHKDGNPLNNSVNNLIYLCSLCHGIVHRD